MGTLDNASNTISLAGCFEDRDGHAALGNMYIRAKINAHTGAGGAVTYPNETIGDCTLGTPAGVGVPVEVNAVRQCANANTAPNYTAANCSGTSSAGRRDSDGDGCPDSRELQDAANGGSSPNRFAGLRDPMNRWDFFNPEKTTSPHTQTVADIIKTVQQFGKSQGNANYSIDTDRTALIGGNAWNLGPPDGQQTVADILAAIKQFNQACDP